MNTIFIILDVHYYNSVSFVWGKQHYSFFRSRMVLIFALSLYTCCSSILMRLKAIDDGYRFVSFDVKSLFANVPLNKTIQVILDRVYKEK